MDLLLQSNQLLERYFKFVKGLLPGEKGVTKIGLDIGLHSCKFVEISLSGDQCEILRWGIEPIKPGETLQSLRALLSKFSLAGKSPVTAISGKGTLIRYVDMPRMSFAELKKSFSLEIDKYFPFDLSTIYTDCCILDPKGKDKKMPVLIAAVKKEMIDERIKILTEAGFEPQQVTINAIAMTNAYQKLGSGDQAAGFVEKGNSSAKMILDIGESVSNLIILKDDVPRFTRDIFIGSQEISRKISNVLGISLEEAEKMQKNPGDQLSNLFDMCESTILNWVSEIRLSLDYFVTEKNIPVDRIFLTGGGSMIPGLNSFFEKSLDISVRTLNLMSSVKFPPDVTKEEIINQSPRFSVAIGLALSQYD